MIKVTPTKHLTGVTIQGDYYDFKQIVDSIYNITGVDEDISHPYYAVRNRLLAICYDIRHASMGNRDVVTKDNGINTEIMKWHNMIVPERNVYYSANILFPEAIFASLAVPETYTYSDLDYGIKGNRTDEGLPHIPYADYYMDRAVLDVLFAGIWQALGSVIGDEELEKILCLKENSNEMYVYYVTHYLDKCNMELLRTDFDKRKDKLKNITKRLIKKPKTYLKIEYKLKNYARAHNLSIYHLSYPEQEYPEEIIW